jgi:hypothetical protein
MLGLHADSQNKSRIYRPAGALRLRGPAGSGEAQFWSAQPATALRGRGEKGFSGRRGAGGLDTDSDGSLGLARLGAALTTWSERPRTNR